MSRRTQTARHGLGDPRIPWVVLLHVGLDGPPPAPDVLAVSLAGVARDAGWPPPSAAAVSTRPPGEGLALLAADSPDILRVAVGEADVVLAARHDALDGLGMLTALGRLLGTPVRSTARGVDPTQRERLGASSLWARAAEITLRPHAVVAPSATGPRTGDVLAATTVEGTPRTADLVSAGARAVVRWNRDHARAARRVSVAVGVSTVGGASDQLADHSGYLRLRNVDQMTPSEVREALVHAALQPGGGGSRPPPGVAAATDLAVRLAAPRLGSTLLVSHLGALEAPASVHAPAFYPVTGGGSGLSLGAASLRDRTTLTLRARASRHDDEGLRALLALVVEELD